MSKKTTSTDPITVVESLTTYSLPELGIAVQAANVEDAVKKAKAQVKKSKEKENV